MVSMDKDKGDSFDTQGVVYLSRDEGIQLLDQQARKYLGMSGEDFQRKYRAGHIEDPDRSEVIRVSFLLPLAEE